MKLRMIDRVQDRAQRGRVHVCKNTPDAKIWWVLAWVKGTPHTELFLSHSAAMQHAAKLAAWR